MEEEERRSELRRRNSKKEKRTAVKEEKGTRMTRRNYQEIEARTGGKRNTAAALQCHYEK